MSKIDYPEDDFVDCHAQCCILSFETFPIEEHTLLDYEIFIDLETSDVIKSAKMKFPSDVANIAAVVLILYVIKMSVVCVKLRINDENLMDENNNTL